MDKLEIRSIQWFFSPFHLEQKSILSQFFTHIKFNNEVVGTHLSEEEMKRLNDM